MKTSCPTLFVHSATSCRRDVEYLDRMSRVKVPSYLPYRYPDLTVVCGKREKETIAGLEMLINPLVIVEVLSPSTEALDRGAKFTYYKSIASLREYILIATDQPVITRFVKQ